MKEKYKNEILDIIYNNNMKLIITEQDVKYINDYYKKNFNNINSYEDLLLDERFSKLVNKLHSAEYEIKKQVALKKALQPGIIAECNFSETLAKIFKLNKVIDLDNAKYNEVPKEFSEFVQGSSQTFSGARYLFYNNKDKNIFIFQYGNPALGDAELIYFDTKIRLEYKEKDAKLGEYDIIYNNEGKLISSEKIKKELKVLELLIDSFNQNTNIFDEIGHNYSAFDTNTCIIAAKTYLNVNGIDFVISSVKDELVAITDDCFCYQLENGDYVVSLEGSEIRPAGRNSKSVWTMSHFYNTLKELNAINIEADKYYIDKKNVDFATARGKEEVSRMKIKNVYFVRYEDIEYKDNGYMFSIDDVRQLVPTISMHMHISATKDELKKVLKI